MRGPRRYDMNDLIFVSMENWDEIWRRNQFVVAELARRHPDNRILFVGLPRNVSHNLRHLRVRALNEPATWNPLGLANVTVTRALKLLPDTLPIGRRINEWMVRRHVNGVARRLTLRDPVLWLNPHYAVHMAGQMGERAVIYDITDDWTTQSQSPRLTRLIQRQDAELCRRADAVIVCSQRLLELKQGLNNSLHLIPNGVDAEHYRTVLDGCGRLPAQASVWPHPVLGYTGSIHPDRVDVGLVQQVAGQLDGGSIVLIGPNFLRRDDLARLQSCANVFFTGPVPYREIPNYMRAFDVCITPHRMTPFTESLNPIKLWEYLAAGKPIVSTDVAGFRDYPELVRIAGDADEFVEAVKGALKEPRELAQLRRDQARNHSWESRVDRVEQVLKQTDSSGADQ